ncbi:hypothetical protein SCHPADRAFT_934329 [Schizopora paradoxa]|uniref:C2H2-type domain-containing protein n=1 Tax=Schizopora paradoxa TaxID=27342 RepID=A0A0H2S8D4_9AGAM|nr:hypothetical protein SCHPADRAFT_934329 [Schizopora paradoxa]
MNSQYINPELLNGNSKQQQVQAQQLDLFSSYNSSELEAILAPHPDLFESELDSSLAGFDPIHFVTLDSDYGFVRDTSALQCGPPSTITVSSESAYDSVGGQPESLYNYTETNYSLPLDFDMDFQRTMDFQRVGHSATKEYMEVAAKQPTATGLLYQDNASDYSYNGNSPSSTYDDPTSFGALPSTSPNLQSRNGSVYSDYGSQAIQHPSMFFDPTPALSRQTRVQSSIGPNRVHGHSSGTTAHSRSSSAVIDGELDSSDPRKKYSCPNCGRCFARQYNLKTHLETHDSNRKKPFVCHHADCNRMFSRKHDLGRHLVSIHHEDKQTVSIGVGAMEKKNRCEHCGLTTLKGKKCDCEE